MCSNGGTAQLLRARAEIDGKQSEQLIRSARVCCRQDAQQVGMD